jgi:hypothetical protein
MLSLGLVAPLSTQGHETHADELMQQASRRLHDAGLGPARLSSAQRRKRPISLSRKLRSESLATLLHGGKETVVT